MWLSSLFGNIASMRSLQLGIIMLCSLILTNCGDVTIQQLGTKNLQKRTKIRVFLVFVGCLGRRFGAQVGSERPSWLHLGRLGLDAGSLRVDLGSIFVFSYVQGVSRAYPHQIM